MEADITDSLRKSTIKLYAGLRRTSFGFSANKLSFIQKRVFSGV